MKQHLTALILAIATTMCAMAATPATTADSLAYYIGKTQGNAMLKRTQSLPAEKQKAYKEDFMRAFRAVITADTINTGYMDGINVGWSALKEIMNMSRAGIPVNRQMLADEFANTLLADKVDEAANRNMLDTLQSILVPLQQQARRKSEDAQKRAQQQWDEIAERNLIAGRNYLEQLKASDKEVITTPSGLAYKVISTGTGPVATDDDMVELTYTGKRIDGTVFDSSKGNTIRFSPKSVIRGFSEGLKLMNKGSHYILYIPAELAYGMQAPPSIGPNSTLIFDVEIANIYSTEK